MTDDTRPTPHPDADALRRAGPIDFARLVRKGGAALDAEPYWISRYLFRPWTAWLSWALVRLGVSANGVTLLSGVVCLAGVVMLAMSRPGQWLAGAALILLYYALDHCDGEVARYERITGRKTHGEDGAFWDSVVHALEPLLIAGLAFRLYHQSGLGLLPLVVAAVDVTALCVAPWQRHAETVLAWMRRRVARGEAVNLRAAGLADAPGGAVLGDAASPTWTWRAWLAQLVLFPGYFLTLAAAVVLDAAAGPIPLGDDRVLYWQMLWLVVHAGGKTASAVRSSITHARALRDLP